MDAHTSHRAEPDTRQKRAAPSLKGPAWGFGISVGLLVIGIGAGAVSVSVYRGMFLFWGIGCFVAICFFLVLVYRMITSKVWRVVFLVVAIPVGLLLQPLLTVGTGIMLGRVHASRAQQDAAPLVAFIESEKAKTGELPNDILPALQKIADRSRISWVWYSAGEKDYDLSVWVTSFYYFDPHPIITIYASTQGTWSGPRPTASLAQTEGRTVLRYKYEVTTGRWMGEKIPSK
ncbi:MAG: hypothetical protein AB1646_11165 [Thermodesulfobacteriota bacterium]